MKCCSSFAGVASCVSVIWFVVITLWSISSGLSLDISFGVSPQYHWHVLALQNEADPGVGCHCSQSLFLVCGHGLIHSFVRSPFSSIFLYPLSQLGHISFLFFPMASGSLSVESQLMHS